MNVSHVGLSLSESDWQAAFGGTSPSVLKTQSNAILPLEKAHISSSLPSSSSHFPYLWDSWVTVAMRTLVIVTPSSLHRHRENGLDRRIPGRGDGRDGNDGLLRLYSKQGADEQHVQQAFSTRSRQSNHSSSLFSFSCGHLLDQPQGRQGITQSTVVPSWQLLGTVATPFFEGSPT